MTQNNVLYFYLLIILSFKFWSIFFRGKLFWKYDNNGQLKFFVFQRKGLDKWWCWIKSFTLIKQYQIISIF